MTFINSPLFQEASRQIKAAATRQFARSDFGQLVGRVRSAIRPIVQSASSGSRNQQPQVRRILNDYGRHKNAETAVRELMGADFGGLVRTIEKYSRGGSDQKKIVAEFLQSLGEPGRLIATLVDPYKSTILKKNLQSALNLIRAFGGEVVPGRGTTWDTPEDLERGLRAARQRLQEMGYALAETQGPPRRSPKPNPGRNTVDVDMGYQGRPGATNDFPPDHPLVTGEMVLATASYSVYEFGYDVDTATLYVRFRKKVKGPDGWTAGGAGPLYAYYGVTPQEFLGLYATRNSGGEGVSGGPGDWVWDNLRQRGTQSGHQKDYRLVGIMDNYVPRKASVVAIQQTIGKRGQTLKRPRTKLEEWYIPRTVKTHEGRFAHSVLPTERVGKVMPARGS
jgi:hypothetical protein